MRCWYCGKPLSRIPSALVYPCFDCMEMHTPSTVARSDRPKISKLKRVRGEWTFGNDPQLKTNQMWSRECEEMYERWLAERILE